jgi:putative flippase GtrA
MTLARQGLSFLTVGIGLIAVDWLVFVSLTALGVAPAAANLAGRVVGAVLGFWVNGRITFGNMRAPRVGGRRFVRFTLLWLLLTLTSTGLIATVAQHLGLRFAWLAKPVVEACLALVSFTVSRHWVYR